MIRSAVTICLVPGARRGPFVYHDNLEHGCREAAELGFDAVEIFAPSGDFVDRRALQALLAKYSLKLAAVGTGAGMLIHGHSLSNSNDDSRAAACAYARAIIDFGAEFGAPAIVGSMQGNSGTSTRASALVNLADSMGRLAAHAASRETELFIEPLNRYETDLVMTLADGARLIEAAGAPNLKLLADLFHMNIEEVDIAGAVTEFGSLIGHVHFVDSNRSAAGMGHLDYEPIAEALQAVDYQGFASVEAFPKPSSRAAAEATIKAFRQHLAK